MARSGCSSSLHESCLIRGCTLLDPVTSACAACVIWCKGPSPHSPDTVGSTEVEAAAWTVPTGPRVQRSHTRSCAAEGDVHPCSLVRLQPNVHAYCWRCLRGCCRVFVTGMAPNTRFRQHHEKAQMCFGSKMPVLVNSSNVGCCPAACWFVHDHQL